MNTPPALIPVTMGHRFARSGGRWWLTCACVLLATQSEFAADGSWNVNLAGTWATGANWLAGTAPGATSGTTNTDIATFGFGITAGRTVTVDANRNIGGITFGHTTAFAYTLATGPLWLTSGGVIQTTPGVVSNQVISAPVVIQGDGGTAAFTGNAGAMGFTGALSGVSTVGNTTTLTLDGTGGVNGTTYNSLAMTAITDGSNGGKLAIVKNGAGTWRLAGGTGNTFSGGFTLNGGVVRTSSTAAGSFGTGTMTLNGGELLFYQASATVLTPATTVVGGNTTITSDRSAAGAGLLHGSSSLSIGANTLTIQGGAAVTSGQAGFKFTGTTTLTGAATFNVVNPVAAGTTTRLTLTGALDNGGYLATFTGTGESVLTAGAGGSGGLTKAGSGTLFVYGTSTYTGPTNINGGTFRVGLGGFTSASSTVTIASGAMLGGRGTVGGPTTVVSGGIVSPDTGVSGPALLSFGSSLTLNGGSITNFDVNGTGRGTTYDAIDVTGTLTYGGTFNLSFGSTIASGTTLDLFGLTNPTVGSYTSVIATGSYAGAFTNNSGAWTYSDGIQQLSFVQSTGDLTFAAVPEPSTYAAILGSVAFVGAALRRRRRASQPAPAAMARAG